MQSRWIFEAGISFPVADGVDLECLLGVQYHDQRWGASHSVISRRMLQNCIGPS